MNSWIHYTIIASANLAASAALVGCEKIVEPVGMPPKFTNSYVASAPTLEEIINAFAAPLGTSANNWDSAASLKFINWSHDGLKETPVWPFSRVGEVDLAKLGRTEILIGGARTMMLELDLTLNIGSVIEPQNFAGELTSQFVKGTSISKVRAKCSDEGAISGSEVYKISLPGKNPVYAYLTTDAGGSSPDSRKTQFQFTTEDQTRWQCSSGTTALSAGSAAAVSRSEMKASPLKKLAGAYLCQWNGSAFQDIYGYFEDSSFLQFTFRRNDNELPTFVGGRAGNYLSGNSLVKHVQVATQSPADSQWTRFPGELEFTYNVAGLGEQQFSYTESLKVRNGQVVTEKQSYACSNYATVWSKLDAQRKSLPKEYFWK
jgi:hypothetical protein